MLYVLFGLYYYLKIANAIFMRQPMVSERVNVSCGMRAALDITVLATIVIGIHPEPLIQGVNWSLGIARASHVAATAK